MANETSNRLDDFKSFLDDNLKDDNLNLVTILRAFTRHDWSTWLENILSYGFAYPISTIDPSGNPIIDMVDLLNRTGIHSFNYDDALSEISAKLSESGSDDSNLENILNALIAINTTKAQKQLIDILESPVISKQMGRLESLKPLALLALARSPKLEHKEVSRIKEYLYLEGFAEMITDSVFCGSTLTFAYSHVSVKCFFEFLSIFCLKYSEHLPDGDNKLRNKQLDTIVDKIEELHFVCPSNFYSSLTNWLINDYEKLSLNINYTGQTFSILLYREILKYINFRKVEIFNMDSITYASNEARYAFASLFLLNLIGDSEALEVEATRIAEINIFLIQENKDNFISFLQYLLPTRSEFVQKNLKSISFLIRRIQNMNMLPEHSKTADLYDDIIYQPWDDSLGTFEKSLKKNNIAALKKKEISKISTQQIAKLVSSLEVN